MKFNWGDTVKDLELRQGGERPLFFGGWTRRAISLGVLAVLLAPPALAEQNSSSINGDGWNGWRPSTHHVPAESLHAAFGVSPVSDAELGEVRGGFTTRNGLKLNIGFELKTILNGSVVAHNVWNSDGPRRHTRSNIFLTIISSDDGGSTEVRHQLGSGGFDTTIVNSQSDVNIEQSNTLTVDVLNHTQFLGEVRSGLMRGAGAGLPNIMKDSLIGAIAR